MSGSWKGSFVISLLLFIAMSCFCLYLSINHEETMHVFIDGQSSMDKDMDNLIHILNERNKTKADIEKLIRGNYVAGDSVIDLNNIRLVFRNDTLQEVVKNWSYVSSQK